MVYDFGIGLDVIRAVMETARDAGGMLQLHCEDRGMLESAVAQLLGAGSTRPAHHADSRPPMVEAAGTECAVALARELRAPMYAVHVSCMAALEHVAAARRAGLPVYAETCPHFLALDASRYGSPDQEAIRYVISPPLRSPADRDALWQGLAEGSLDVVATDHVPDRLAVEKRYVGQPFTEISNGAPGIETLLSVVYSAGVASGRITLERMVDVVSTTPARLFGLAGKGAIEVGRDADVVLFDPSIRRTILAADLHHTSDYTPYEGMSVNGAIRTVLVRGRDVIRDGRYVGRRGFGRFQPRAIDWSQ
ncbi:MAG: amidohydrolase family protein [Chloroflexi bacterium]|nr:amidohydrolase family protein [Chloroflexota bacterium]